MAQEQAKENQLSLQKDLDARRAGSSVQRPVANREDEPMDTSSSIPNGSVNGYLSATSPGFDYTNGNGGGSANTPSQELQDFVIKTFRKHFVLTLNELKRLLNLHVASMPAGQPAFLSISDHTLQDAILLCSCKQIMVPVSTDGGRHSKLRICTVFGFSSLILDSQCYLSYLLQSISLCFHFYGSANMEIQFEILSGAKSLHSM